MTPVMVAGSTPGYGGLAGSFCIGKRVVGRYGSTRGPPGQQSRLSCLGSLALQPLLGVLLRAVAQRRQGCPGKALLHAGTHLQAAAGSVCTG